MPITPHNVCLLERSQVDFEYIKGDDHDEAAESQEPLPCFEVAGFGHYRHDPSLQGACKLLDWPPVWAAAVVDELLGVTETYLYETADEAREDARDLAALLLNDQHRRRQTVPLDELACFERLVAFECVIHGPLSQDGALATAPKSCAAHFLRNVEAYQKDVAARLLTVMELGLRLLPPDVRRRVYSYAATPRAHPESIVASHPDATQVQIHAIPGPPDQPWSGLHAYWTLSMPCEATTNDAKRHVHAHLYEVNAAMPAEQRLSESEMQHLRMEWGWSWQSDDCQNTIEPPTYVLGAQLFRQLIDEFRLRGEEPRLWVFV